MSNRLDWTSATVAWDDGYFVVAVNAGIHEGISLDYLIDQLGVRLGPLFGSLRYQVAHGEAVAFDHDDECGFIVMRGFREPPEPDELKRLVNEALTAAEQGANDGRAAAFRLQQALRTRL